MVTWLPSHSNDLAILMQTGNSETMCGVIWIKVDHIQQLAFVNIMIDKVKSNVLTAVNFTMLKLQSVGV